MIHCRIRLTVWLLQPLERHCSNQSPDVKDIVNKLYDNLEEASALITFRRSIAEGGRGAIVTLSNLIMDGIVALENPSQSSAILDTLISGRTVPELAAHAINAVMRSSHPQFAEPVRISAMHQALAMSCFYDSTLDLLTRLSKDPVQTNISTAATVTLGAFASKHHCSSAKLTDGINHRKKILTSLKKNGMASDLPEDRVSMLYALANTRQPEAFTIVTDHFDHPSLPVRIAAVRAIANIDHVCYLFDSLDMMSALTSPSHQPQCNW